MTPPRLLIVTPTRRELAGAERFAPTAIVGIGPSSADATQRAIEAHRPALLLSIGFSGALHTALRTGDAVVSQTAILVDAADRLTLSPAHAVPAQQTLANAGIRTRLGDTLTAHAPVLASAEKAILGETSGAAIVDMETYWIATAAAEANVPMLSVRTVIDEAHHDLPTFVGAILADGGRNETRHALRALRNPANIAPMVAMALHARKATAATRLMLRVLVPSLINAPHTQEAHP